MKIGATILFAVVAILLIQPVIAKFGLTPVLQKVTVTGRSPAIKRKIAMQAVVTHSSVVRPATSTFIVIQQYGSSL